jgi:predicted nucleic acid-binding Zn ribbon protein
MAAKSKASPISEIIHSVFAKLEGAANPSQEGIESLWKELVGQDGFRHSRPVALRKKVLNILVDNSSWMQELSMRKRNILKGLKRKLGKDRISEIHFRIGEF